MKGEPDVSVIVPAYRAERTLGACLESVLAQVTDREVEAIVVTSADSAAELPQLPSDPRLRVLSSPSRLRAAAARNRAVEASRGRLLVFTDADVVADPGWLDNLVAAADGGVVVAGAVRNGTPGSAAGTAQYLLEFLDYLPGRPAAGLWHGATCNLLVPRSVWERFGPFVEGLEGGEDTLLTTRAHAAGLLRFAPDAVVVHRNRTSVIDVMRHVHGLGRKAAHVSRRGAYRARVVVATTALAPLAGLLRSAALLAKLATWGAPLRRGAIRSAPLLVAGLAAWTIGLAIEGARIDRSARRSRSRANEDWEIEGLAADRLPEGWRRHARQVHLELIRSWVGSTSGRWLKTDLQEERSPVRSLVPQLQGTWLGVDVAVSVAAAARASSVAGSAADVRRLPFPDRAFDGILSTSTLDHFHDVAEIDVSLRELRRVLTAGGHLVLTLDNPQNPLIRLRNALPDRSRRSTGLVPFHVGPTLSERDGIRSLEKAGFRVLDTEHLLHVPHIVGTRAARFRWWERRALPWFDRARGTRLGRYSGHFVAFHAVADITGMKHQGSGTVPFRDPWGPCPHGRLRG